MKDAPKTQRRTPAAFILKEQDGTEGVKIEEAADFTALAEPRVTPPPPARRSRGAGWLAGLFWAVFGALVSLYLIDALWSLVLSLETKAPLVGMVALGLVLLVGMIVLVVIIREGLAFLRLGRINVLRARTEAARHTGDAVEVKRAIDALVAFYIGDPSMAAARAMIARTAGEILDPATRLDEAERVLLQSKDKIARGIIVGAAQRVSVVTAVSPRALFDVLFVAAQSFVMIRQLSALYGGRASGLALLRLTARVLGHLAITGGVGIADQLLGQMLGAGLVARLSAKLGEGVLNGTLSARVGIAALDHCRPMEFRACNPIALSEVVGMIITREKIAENTADAPR